MIRLISFLSILLVLGCCKSKKVENIDKSLINSEKTIINTESILKQINSSEKYKNLKPVFSTNGKNIYLSYGDFEKDFNYRVDTFNTLKFLDDKSFDQLKKNIYSLYNVGIKDQDYVVYDPDLEKGIYIYMYKYEDWMAEERQMIPYIALAKNIDTNNQPFFEIIFFKLLVRYN